MNRKCDCGSIVRPINASDGRNYRPFTIKTINLIDSRNGLLYQYGSDAHKIILANALGLISDEEYEEILYNIKDFFKETDFSKIKEGKNFTEKVSEFMDLFGLDLDEAEEKAIQYFKRSNNNKNNGIQKKIISHLPEISDEQLEEVAAQIIEFNTIKNTSTKITLEEALEKQIELSQIKDKNEIYFLNKEYGVKNAQVSLDIEIITSTFGYTRRAKDPKDTAGNSNVLLSLKSYRDIETGKNLVYTSKLETEGILIEFDKVAIINWLKDNQYINDYQVPDLEDNISVNNWFIENVQAHKITNFNSIDECDGDLRITSKVYNLLHTMSHAFIKSAGEISGLDKNSMAELIFPNIAAIFIYANTTQGIPLGVLSGMFEQNYKLFIQQAKDIIRKCVFDPICMERDNGACSACAYLSEVSCCHFNKDLSRKNIVGYKNKDELIKGFWEYI